jgi:glyoxylase I family protein
MKIEHLALNVADPVAMADWYVEHLGLTVRRSTGEPVHCRFMADDGGAVMLEIYRNTDAAVLDLEALDPLILHLAFASDDVEADRTRLIAAGCTPVQETEALPNGDTVTMLRDPWGLAVQLVRRAAPMI